MASRTPEDIAVNRAVAQVIRKRRLNLGLTQATLAEWAGYDKTAICLMENGTYRPNLKMLVKMAPALRMSPGDIINEAYIPIRRFANQG